jgi:putative salt-induced outer membrane protein YdiY
MRPRWSYVGLGILQQNEELSLNLRSVVGGGFVRILAQSNRSLSDVQLGVAYTREQYAGEGDRSVAEAVTGFNWDWFTFDGRSTNLELGLLTFVALDDDSRFRLELQTSFKSDIVGDLYWSVNAFESYNSSPPTDRKKSDFGVSATLGWTF